MHPSGRFPRRGRSAYRGRPNAHRARTPIGRLQTYNQPNGPLRWSGGGRKEPAVITHQQQRAQRGASERRIEPPSPDALFESGFYIPFNEVPLGTTGGAQVLANGNLAMSWLDSSFEGSVDAKDVPGPARARVGLNGAVTMEFALEAGADVSDSFRLALVGLPPFTIEPVTVSPFVQVKLDFAATAETAGRVSVVAPFHIGSGFLF